jgi:hypothetical protein
MVTFIRLLLKENVDKTDMWSASLENGYYAGGNLFGRPLLFVNIDRSFYWGRTVASVDDLPPVE